MTQVDLDEFFKFLEENMINFVQRPSIGYDEVCKGITPKILAIPASQILNKEDIQRLMRVFEFGRQT
jgi:hypothetical protein